MELLKVTSEWYSLSCDPLLAPQPPLPFAGPSETVPEAPPSPSTNRGFLVWGAPNKQHRGWGTKAVSWGGGILEPLRNCSSGPCSCSKNKQLLSAWAQGGAPAAGLGDQQSEGWSRVPLPRSATSPSSFQMQMQPCGTDQREKA